MDINNKTSKITPDSLNQSVKDGLFTPRLITGSKLLKQRKPTKPFLRGDVYWWKKRIPKSLQAYYETKGFRPTHVFQKSLDTSDELLANLRCIDWDNWLYSGGETPEDNGPSKADIYERVLAEYMTLLPDPRHNTRPDFLDDTLMQDIRDGEVDKRDLSIEDRAKLAVIVSDNTGRPKPEEFMYTLRSCLRDYRKVKANDVTLKTLNKFDRSVDVFLGDRPDMPMEPIKMSYVQNWIDDGLTDKAYGTKQDYVTRLAALWTYARQRGRVDENRANPFIDQDLGKNDKKTTLLMEDEQLLALLPHLKKPEDLLPPIIARHTGMRLGEVFHAKLDTVDGLLCFIVKETADDEWKPKTDASIRVVPVRDSIRELVLEVFPKIRPSYAKAYSQKFGRIKNELFPNTQRVLVFHSLRKTFITFALRQGHSTEHVAHVVGHEEGKGNAMTGRRYMEGHLPEFLKNIIETTPPLVGYEASL